MTPIAARRKHNAPERRRQLADAAIELLGANGARGLSHPKVDARAGVPAGSTSFYFRTRQALLLGAAERLTELDIADLSEMAELAQDGSARFSGATGLAHIVMYAATEPWLTRTKARYELMLQASRDAELADTMQQSVHSFYALARDVVGKWSFAEPDRELAEQQAVATLTFINGVLMSFVVGRPVVDDAEHLASLIRGVIAGVREEHRH